MKLWDLSGYFERTISKEPAWLKVAFRGQIVSRYKPSYALITPNLDVILLKCMSQQIPEFHKFNFL